MLRQVDKLMEAELGIRLVEIRGFTEPAGKLKSIFTVLICLCDIVARDHQHFTSTTLSITL